VEHVVFYPGADGAEAFCRAADLEEAVRVVERLRNDNGVGDVSVFALHAVPLAFRTYVHVELPVSEPEPFDVSFEEPSIPPPPPTPVAAEVVEASVPQAEVDVEATPITLEVEAADPYEEPAPLEAPELVLSELEDVAVVVAVVEAAGSEYQEQNELPVVQLPAPPPPPSDFFESFPDDQAFDAPAVELPLEVEAFEAEPAAETAAEPEPFEPEPYVVETFAVDEADVADQAEIELDAQDAEGSIPIPTFESSAAELPPLTLAPGPLLFDGDDAPAPSAGAYDVVEEAPADLTDLIPADFTDLIPSDIAHGDLPRDAENEAPVPELDQPEPSPELPAEPVAEQAPSTEELPPMDVAEIPSDVSSIEMLAAASFPVARETNEEPVPSSHREGPRGLGYFGG
jgi:hypothetical protein